MKYFSTGFYIPNNYSFSDIFNECFSWIHESPHTSFIPAELECDCNISDFHVESKNESIDIISYETECESLGCFRYSKISLPHRWVTDISINKNLKSDKMWIQVESSVVSQEAALPAPKPKKPLIVIKLIDKFSGADDDVFKISTEPFYLSNNSEHLNLASKVINGETDNRLPIIYVSSKYFFSEHPHNIIPTRLARKLCGLAHVLIEPGERGYSINLKQETDGKNAYGGSVGIYWPRGKDITYYRRGDKSAKEFEEELFTDIVKAITAMAPVSDSGWNEIKKRKTKDAIEAIKARGDDTRELMELYESDNVSKDEKIEDLNRKIRFLEERVRTLLAQASSQGCIALNAGDETDFFEGEIKNVIIQSIELARNNTKEKTRRHHILSSLLSSNTRTNEGEIKLQQLKSALAGYRSMDDTTSKKLKELGFELSEEGKHWKITYHEDSRYMYILPKTGSDYRGSLNAVSDIKNLIF